VRNINILGRKKVIREKLSGIYYIRNKINNKLYVGQSQNIYNEWICCHRTRLRNNKHFNKYLQRSWNKYGEDNFEHGIITIENNIDILGDLEIYWIKELHSHKTEWGYNLSWGGESIMRGLHQTDDAKRKISIATSGSNNPFYGKKHTEETKELMRGRVMPEDERKRRMKPLSEEHKKSLSDNHADFRGEKSPKFGKKTKNARSKFFGVGFFIEKRGLKHWTAFLNINGKNKRIGRYLTEIEAAEAYDKFVIENNINRPLNFDNKKDNYE